MSWQLQTKNIGSVLTIKEWDRHIKEQVRMAEICSPHIVEHIKQVDALVRNEVRRIQDANPYSDWQFMVCANGHGDDPIKSDGAVTITIQVQWTHRG
jgi:hypothetical protein